MKIKNNILVSVMLVVLLVVLAIPAVMFIRKNPITKANRLKSNAKEQYLRRDYVSAYHSYKRLIDSLLVTNDAASVNYANAGYLSSELLMKGLKERARMNEGAGPDSAVQQIGYASREKFLTLTSSQDQVIASIASNQIGYATLKGSNIFEDEKSDSLLFDALIFFKNAVRKDPGNDSARYNYELVKRIIDFPETVMSEAKAMIAQKRYREAARLMEDGMRRDPRLRRQKDFMQRLRTVITIDSLGGRGL